MESHGHHIVLEVGYELGIVEVEGRDLHLNSVVLYKD